MAKAPAKTADEVSAKGRKGEQAKVYAWLLALTSVVLFFPTVILLVVGMAPTIVAAISDRHRQKFTTRTVGYVNLCGCLPYAIDLWSSSHTIDSALAILADPFSWLSMYGAAAVGWVIHASVPPVVAAYLAVRSELRETALKARQRELIEEWGIALRERAGAPAEEDANDGGESPSDDAKEPRSGDVAG